MPSAGMSRVVTLIRLRGVTLTCWRAGTGHTNMLTCCHPEMLKSGHAVALTCWQAPDGFRSMFAGSCL